MSRWQEEEGGEEGGGTNAAGRGDAVTQGRRSRRRNEYGGLVETRYRFS